MCTDVSHYITQSMWLLWCLPHSPAHPCPLTAEGTRTPIVDGFYLVFLHEPTHTTQHWILITDYGIFIILSSTMHTSLTTPQYLCLDLRTWHYLEVNGF